MITEVAHLVPWLDVQTIVPLAGATCETYAVNDSWIVQIGRTNYAANTLRHQARVLPKLATHLGAKVPGAQLVCDGPTTIVYKRIDGVRCDEATNGAWSAQLGGLLSRLHAIPPNTLGLETVGADTLRADHRDDCRRLLAAVAPRLDQADRIAADRLVSNYLDDEANWRFAPTVIHGDLVPANVLVSSSGELVGVIDWEEVRTGDPASDFAWWLHADPAIGERMVSAYGGAPEPRFAARARHAYALAPWHDVAHGIALRDEPAVAAALDGVRARLAQAV